MAHTVYIHDKPLTFVQLYDAGKHPFQSGFLITSEQEMTVKQAINELSTDKSPSGIIYLCEDPETNWKLFCRYFQLVEAAGGIVENPSGEVLTIFRRGKWDLPKGKVDGSESPEEAAVREVEEECGIHAPALGDKLTTTFHTYQEGGKHILKKTHWYRMAYDGSEPLIPQVEEDIDSARWMSKDHLHSEFFKNTYGSIRGVLQGYLHPKKKEA